MTTINTNKMQPKAGQKAFLMLIRALNDADQYGRRHDYAFRHSNGRTESTKELTETEAMAVIRELMEKYDVKDDLNQKRRKLISLAHQMGWQIGDKADMQRIELWCVNKGPYHKPLNSHTGKELNILVSVFEKIYKQHMNKL